MGEADALDLPATYNSMGLALREAGRGGHAEVEAFLAGLLVAPEDLALLVNGGAAHQVLLLLPTLILLLLHANITAITTQTCCNMLNIKPL